MNLYPKHFTSLPLNHLHIKMNFFLLIENFFFLYFNSLWIIFFLLHWKHLTGDFLTLIYSLLFFTSIIFPQNFINFFMNLIAHREWQAQKRNVCSSWSLTRNWAAEREFSLAVCFFGFIQKKKLSACAPVCLSHVSYAEEKIAITILY